VKRYKHFREKLILAVKGMLMGMADIVPGVSGGTIALISGIYEHLIMALSKIRPMHALDALSLPFVYFNSEQKKKKLKSLSEIPWEFLIPLGVGILIGIIGFSRLALFLFDNHPLYTYSFFFGLISFSLTIPYRAMHKHIPDFILLVVFALITWALTSVAENFPGSTQYLYVFFCGAIAVCAMILPGISGAFILVILGEYQIILDSLHDANMKLLLVFIFGLVVGIMTFVRLLKYILYKHHSRAMAALTGIMLGSIHKLWPMGYLSEPTQNYHYLMFAVFSVLGALFLYFLEKVAIWLHDPEPPVQ